MNNPPLPGYKPVVFIVDDEASVLKAVSRGIEKHNYEVRSYSSAAKFLEEFNDEHGCLILDLKLPEMDGLKLQAELRQRKLFIPIIFISGFGGVADSVDALRKGAIDFLVKPFSTERLVKSIEEGIRQDAIIKGNIDKHNSLLRGINSLTNRERDVFDLLVNAPEPPSSKSIALTLDISHRTVEHHKARIFDKLGVRTSVELRLTVGNIHPLMPL